MLASALAAATFLVGVASAQATDLVYWSNYGDGVSFASLGGGGGGDLNTSGAAVSGPYGTAIDTAKGRLYWANWDGNSISYVNLDGSGGGGQLNTSGATVNHPDGLVIDQATGRIYWGNRGGTTISYANLDGSGGGDLNTTGATVSTPSGVAIDSSDGRIYWANTDLNPGISYANVDGSGGGGNLPISSSYIGHPQGVAIDTATGVIYWADQGSNTINYANLDGSGAGMLNTSGATRAGPAGVSLDLAANRIYWANVSDGISYASLSGTGGANLDTSGATTNNPTFPVILKSPSGTGGPAVSGGTFTGSQLTCSQGSWAADDLGALMYDSPTGYSYSWAEDGTTISGATSDSYTAQTPGAYTCTVTAANYAGQSSQTSSPHVVAPPGSPSARIESPKPGSTFLRGAHVSTRFSCSDPNGPGIASCKDSNGSTSGHGHLNTSSPGKHSYSVTATSKDGKNTTTAENYYVVAAKILTSRTRERHGRVGIVLRCLGAASSRCSGTLTLSGGVKGKAKFRITAGHRATIEVPVTGTGTRALATARIGGRVAATRRIAISRAAPTFTG